ncbi:hypothetical protein L198_06925 [Cryptococcus wingfieldii CBS 7118]|uniref:beta-glucosidase n=1 Tax=Cryptococcus wingfieldii CBS 7118 TaxID=1295528 RepID=A0A1E3IGH7_9TREE|nr:hypothetical protein L198_06925 [Cryptococcus wingfieldii CBS 7118]ODN87699.1 hypothetical protein L198_06925 [Cryptococcus wingfieldii CBS 7118]
MSSNSNTILRCTITNIGSTPGREIIQTYVSALLSSISRPSRELRWFVKTKLSSPGKVKWSASVSIKRLSHITGRRGGQWKLEKDEYQVLVGASSVDIRETIEEDFNF